MNVKSFYPRTLSYPLMACLLIVIVLSGIFLSVGKTQFEKTTENIVLRKIGHELLWSTGDSVSRILPIKEISSSEFQLSFEKPFSFMPDSLVKVTARIMRSSKLSANYAVNVIEAKTGEVFYTFSVAGNSKDMVPCIGRLLPPRNYRIDILMQSPVIAQANYIFMGTTIFLFTLLGGLSVSFYKRFSKKAIQKTTSDTLATPIGKYLFYPREHLLVYNQHQTVLTAKECKLLGIFCTDMNNVIDRNRLLKEGWEDEGVITTRSLDMFVSKLRKKLLKDPLVQIKNAHGKGYSLEGPTVTGRSL